MSELTLTLGPDRLRLSSAASSVLPIELARERAGWLVAQEAGSNWHWRHVALFDGRAEQPIAQFVGTLASVRVKTAGVPLSEAIPNEVPVAVLVGSWWPHPARRMTRGGNMNARFRWRDPDLADFPRHERWQRLLWTLLYGAFALMLLAVAILEEGRPFWFRFVAAGSAFGLLVWRARLLRRRPRFLDARQLHGGVRPSPD